MNQFPLTVECLKLIEKNIKNVEEVIIIDNSDTDFLAFEGLQEVDSRLINNLKVIRNIENVGVRESLNQGWKNSTGEIVLFMHNDLMMYEKDFDEKLKETFKKVPQASMIGAFGAKGLGVPGIFEKPYEMSQLSRIANVSNAIMDKEIHGFRNLGNSYENVAVFDGMFMCIRKSFLELVGGFDECTETFHNYDNLICVKSVEKGFENLVVPLAVDHLGGRTTVAEDWAKKFGKDKQQVHTDAHPPLYNYLKKIGRIWIEDIFDEHTNLICGYALYLNGEEIKMRIYEN
jgi:GT2 family glycosyltransferase